MQQEKLKRCPFCGGDGILVTTTTEYWDNYSIICNGENNGDCAGLGGSSKYEAKEDAIKAWNTRAEAQKVEQIPIGWLTREKLFTDIPVKACIESGMWTPLYTSPPPQEGVVEKLEQAHMAGQADAGVDPSYSNAQLYVERVLKAAQGEG